MSTESDISRTFNDIIIAILNFRWFMFDLCKYATHCFRQLTLITDLNRGTPYTVIPMQKQFFPDHQKFLSLRLCMSLLDR